MRMGVDFGLLSGIGLGMRIVIDMRMGMISLCARKLPIVIYKLKYISIHVYGNFSAAGR